MKIELRDVRVQLGLVAAVLLLFDLAAGGVLLSPAGRSRTARVQVYRQMLRERDEKQKAVAPAQGMDQKIADARQQEDGFHKERLASRYSAMSEQIARLASEAGVSVTHVRYDERELAKGTPAGYDHLGITIQVNGSYAQNIRFINEVERQKLLLLIDGVSFGGMKGNTLTVDIHISTYLMRSAA